MCYTFFLCNDLIPTLLSLGINLFKCKEIYLYIHVCVSVSIHMHGYTWRGRFAHRLSVQAGKSTWTKLKHLDNFTFCSQCLSKGRDPWGPVPTRLHTKGEGSAQAGSRNTLMPLSTQPLSCPQERRHQGTSSPHYSNLHLLSMVFDACLLSSAGAFHQNITESSRRSCV